MEAIPTSIVLVTAAALFCLGALGFLLRRNVIVVFMCIELMLNAANLTFLAVARERGLDMTGQIYSLIVITVAAAEAAVGLAIVIAVFRLRASADVDAAHGLHG